jgi:hypothetical protein
LRSYARVRRQGTLDTIRDKRVSVDTPNPLPSSVSQSV